jgi:hypothetical protein
MPLFDRLPALWRPAVMPLSLGGMITASVITPSGAGFPAPWALVAVVSTAVFIAFPWQPRRARLNPLANPVMTHVGDISYSLYLWHFPALILITEAFRGLPGDKTAIPAVVSIVVALGLSELSYRYVEETVRKSRWLEPKKKRRARAPGFRGRAIGLGSVAAMTGAALVIAFAVQQHGQSPEPTAEKTTTGPEELGSQLQEGGDQSALAALSDGIKTALGTKSWPELTPSMDSVVEHYEFEQATQACAGPVYPGVDACSWGDPNAPHSIALVGDSMSIAYLAMFRTIVDGSGGLLRVSSLGQFSCPFVEIRTNSPNPKFEAGCPARKERAIADIATLKPEVLFIANGAVPDIDLDTGNKITPAEYQQGLKRYLHKVTGNAGKVVLLTPPPAEKDVRECYSPRNSPAKCVTSVPARWKEYATLAEQTVAEAGGQMIDTIALFCISNKCPAFAEGIPVKFDTTHITEDYARHIAPAFLVLLAEKGVSLTGP